MGGRGRLGASRLLALCVEGATCPTAPEDVYRVLRRQQRHRVAQRTPPGDEDGDKVGHDSETVNRTSLRGRAGGARRASRIWAQNTVSRNTWNTTLVKACPGFLFDVDVT